MRVVAAGRLESLAVPGRVALGSEEVGAAVVVDAVDPETHASKNVTASEPMRPALPVTRTFTAWSRDGAERGELGEHDGTDYPGSGASPALRPPCETRPMRVAVPLEQCWHEVPGGTARTRSISWRRSMPGPTSRSSASPPATRAPPPDPWRPPVEVRPLPLPRLALYEAWHGLRRPRVERVTGPVDVLHVVGGAVAASRAPMVVTIHDLAFLHHPGDVHPARSPVLRASADAGPRRGRVRARAVEGDARGLRRRRHRPVPPAPRPVGHRPSARDRAAAVDAAGAAFGIVGATTSWWSARSSPARTCAGSSRPGRCSTDPT